jgi:Mg-chelatase subunit ChlD
MQLLSAAFLIVAVTVNFSPAESVTKCLVDVVFCIDNSGSIGGEGTNSNWDKQIKFVQDLVGEFNVGPSQTHVGAVDFGWYGYLDFDLNKYQTEAEVQTAIGSIKFKGQQTNTTGGLYYSRLLLTDPQYGRRGPEVPKIIIIITDGLPNREEETLDAEVANIRAAGIRVVGVGVTSGVSKETMLRMVTSESDYVHATDFSNLDAIKDKVINDQTCTVATESPPPTTKPPPPPSPPTTQPPPPPPPKTTTKPPPPPPTKPPKPVCVVDVVFCIDNSASIDKKGENTHNWADQIKFIQDLVAELNVGPSTTHVGAVDFGTQAYRDFDLKKYSTEAEVKAAIGAIKFKSEWTNTTGGLYYSRLMLTDPKYGPRGPEVPKIIILITDGAPNKQNETLDAEVANIRAAGIRVVGIGVTSGVSDEVMLRMVTSKADYIRATDFSQLGKVKDQVINEHTCSAINEADPFDYEEDCF